ncbi:MAG: heavy-metal-associated domain-containing protein [Bacteroidetes bacterium]|nr:heavy-metal-associated domain-containing protein [Bacteroidota bacterium]
METLKFKTNIKCSGCVAKVTPFLNNESEIKKWDVDILNPDKTLTIETESMNADTIIETIEKVGFKAEKI